jgi:quercetin dioxygenase-like cupin family protein
MHKLLTGFAALMLVLAATTAASAQVMTPPAGKEPITRTPLQKTEYPDGHFTYVMMVEIVPNGTAAPHTHPGIETSYILEGDLTLTIQGQPPRKLKAGDSFTIPPHAVHTGTAGDKGMKLIGIFVVDKTKPLASPAQMTQ